MKGINSYLEEIQSEIIYYDKEISKVKQPGIINMFAESLRWNESRSIFPKKKTIPDNILFGIIRKDKQHIKDIRLFIAEDKGNIVGFITASIDKQIPIGYIWGLYVAKGYRRQVVTDKLFDNAFSWLKSKQVNEIELNIKGGNEQAVSFYKNKGFGIKTYILRAKASKYSDPFYHTPHDRFK